MIVEVVRLLDRWLKSETYGVEAMLATVPRQTPENTTDPEPEMPAIVNDTEDEDVAKDLEPAAVPALVLYGTVGPDIPIDAKGSRSTQMARSAIVAIAYVTRDVPWLDAVRDGGYVLRAVRRSLSAYNSLEKSREFRRLNTITIAQIRNVGERQVKGGVGNSQLVGFLLATVVIIDSDP